MKIIARLAFAAILFSALPSFAAGLEELYVYPFIEYFRWDEFKSSGQKILTEEGPVGGIGVAARINPIGGLMLSTRAEFFYGQVHYNGQTQQDPNPLFSERPVKTTTEYYGGKGEGDLGFRITHDKLSLEPFAGLGFRGWQRNIQGSSSTDTTGIPFAVSGSGETWGSLYGRFGARGTLSIDQDLRFFAEGGAKYPFYNFNQADFSGITTTVKPDSEWSAFAEAGFRYKRLQPRIFYEGFRFAKSPAVVVRTTTGDSITVFQPRTESDIIGISVGYAFW